MGPDAKHHRIRRRYLISTEHTIMSALAGVVGLAGGMAAVRFPYLINFVQILAWYSLLSLTFLKILAAAVTIGSGGSGGIFAPSMFIGAMAGVFFGMVVHSLWPGATASPGAYGIVGMGAVVAATTHGPLTAILILFEMTGDYKIILPVVAADDDHRLMGVVSRRGILGAYDKAVLKKSLFSKS